jgi:hypothetical protein
VKAARVESTTIEAVIAKSAMEVANMVSMIEVAIAKSAIEASADNGKVEAIVVRPPVIPVGRVLNRVTLIGRSCHAACRRLWGSAFTTR